MQPPEFTDLIRRHAGLIHKIARAYCREPADREDVVSEIVVQLWRSEGRYDRSFRETTWIYRIALNVAISFQRRERRHRAGRLDGDEHLIHVAAPPEDEADPRLELLQRGIDALGAFDKALVLLYLDGNEHAAIAEVLGISVSNVGTKLLRIKAKLRLAFEQRERRENKETSHGTR